MSLTINEVSQLVERMSKFTDEEVELFVKLAVEKGLTFDPDYLRFTLKDLRRTQQL